MGEAPPEPAPSDLERLAARFVALWSHPFPGSSVSRLALLAVLACLCLVRAYIGLSGITDYSHDAFGALDGTWRVLNGQRPHADFYSPLGPLIYLVTAFGLLLAHGGAEGAGYSQARCGGLLGLWTYLLSRRRLGHRCRTPMTPPAMGNTGCTMRLCTTASTAWLVPFRLAVVGIAFYAAVLGIAMSVLLLHYNVLCP